MWDTYVVWDTQSLSTHTYMYVGDSTEEAQDTRKLYIHHQIYHIHHTLTVCCDSYCCVSVTPCFFARSVSSYLHPDSLTASTTICHVQYEGGDQFFYSTHLLIRSSIQSVNSSYCLSQWSLLEWAQTTYAKKSAKCLQFASACCFGISSLVRKYQQNVNTKHNSTYHLTPYCPHQSGGTLTISLLVAHSVTTVISHPVVVGQQLEWTRKVFDQG